RLPGPRRRRGRRRRAGASPRGRRGPGPAVREPSRPRGRRHRRRRRRAHLLPRARGDRPDCAAALVPARVPLRRSLIRASAAGRRTRTTKERCPMRPIRRGALAALLLLGAAACGDDGGGGGSGGGGSLATFRDALAAVPADDLAEGALITWADLDAATDAAGLERPEAGDGEALVDWLLALTGEEDSVVMVPFADTLQIQSINGRAAEFEAELGWTVADVDAFVELSAPPARFFVGAGDLCVDGED